MRDDEPRVIKPGFHAEVYAIVREIPFGRVATYGDVASALGAPSVARQVGWALAALREDDVPWHRVVNAQGRISARGDLARATLQRTLLEAEGVVFDALGCIAMSRYRSRPRPRI
ncbi:MAG: MGMT family protein [Alphaproteobacteria bacterium]|nr:MGMT family protein [Alphaproteobacteria bacterium]